MLRLIIASLVVPGNVAAVACAGGGTASPRITSTPARALRRPASAGRSIR
jgi:hypothetical protein